MLDSSTVNFTEKSGKKLQIFLQLADIRLPTGNGKKLSCSQAQLGQATCLAVALFLSISCGQSYVRRLYTARIKDGPENHIIICMLLNCLPIPDDNHVKNSVSECVLGVGVATLLNYCIVNRLVGVTGGPGQVIFAEVG